MSESESFPVYVLAHIDVIPFPPQVDDGREVLLRWEQTVRRQGGLIRFELLRELHRPNHFETVAVWSSVEAYEAHLGHPDTLAYRQELHPCLGSPFDDQVHILQP